MINAKYGCTPQMILNKYRSQFDSSGEINLQIWSDERIYETDLKELCASATGPWEKSFYGAYEKGSMDCAVIDELPFINTEGLQKFFNEVHGILRENGQIVLAAKNPARYSVLEQLIYNYNVSVRTVVNINHLILLMIKAGFRDIQVFKEVDGCDCNQDFEKWKAIFPDIKETNLDSVLTVNQFFLTAVV